MLGEIDLGKKSSTASGTFERLYKTDGTNVKILLTEMLQRIKQYKILLPCCSMLQNLKLLVGKRKCSALTTKGEFLS